MSNIRTTFGSVLGTVTAAANVVGNTMNTASGGVDMLNRFVESASVDQRERQVAHRATFRSTLVREASIEIAKGNAEALAFAAESETNAKLFNDAQSDLLAAFAAFDDPKN